MDPRLQAVLLAVHIAGGSVGLLSGLLSMVASKGARTHRLAGQAFFISMLIMAASGAIIAPFRETGRWTNTVAGIFSFYLVATAWAAARRRPGEVGRFEVVALAAPSPSSRPPYGWRSVSAASRSSTSSPLSP